MYVDVHAHLTHQDFAADLPQVLARAQGTGLGAVVCNGLEPESNRRILDLASQFPLVRPALGIYPVDGVHHLLPEDFPHPCKAFDVEAEIAFIAREALAGHLAAVGEIGLDGYWLDESTIPAQERVFASLVQAAMAADLPVIVHSRKLEERCMAILAELGAQKVVMHCFGARVSLAQTWAESRGWCFSIPANARVNHGFTKMLTRLPPECLLTETDCPYLGPVRGERNEPAFVAGTVAYLAELRDWSLEAARDRIWNNYRRLFS